MILEDISNQLDSLFCTYDALGGISIGTSISFEGDPTNFLFQQEDDKYARITTNRNFSEWMADCTSGWMKAAPRIEELAKPYGVQWDNENGALFIRFRRNEMSVAEAVMRLYRAVSVVGSLGWIVKL
jgi:hypothetical protein